MQKRIVIGVDQSTGASSAFGIAIYDPNKHELISSFELWPNDKKPEWLRVLQISHQMSTILGNAYKQYGPLEVRCENFVMRGRTGQILAWAVGTVIAALPPNCIFAEVHNIKNKVNMTGSNIASKADMGKALLTFFENKKNFTSIDAVRKLLDNKSWDAIDAACIAVYGDGENI